jgi:hypothetical protein
VWQSTGFKAAESDTPTLPDEHQRIADAARPYYERLKVFKL